MTIYVFVGPTLSLDEARSALQAIYLPPVSQGDVYRVGLSRPDAIGIIDGYFDRVPAVWHKEILWAMAQGIRIYGSASMGALRAAELAPFGMEGVGEIFEAYRDGRLEDDDEVAVAHGLGDTGYRSLSVPMVNIRQTLAKAAADGVISGATRETLERLAKGLFYPDRLYKLIIKLATEQGLPPEELRDLNTWLPDNQIDQKQRDALDMLRHMKEHLATIPTRGSVTYKLEHTVFWDRLMLHAGGADAQAAAEPNVVTTDDIFDELRLRGVGYLDASERGVLRDLALREAQHKSYRPDPKAVQKKATEFRQTHALHTAEEFDQWLKENALGQHGFDGLIEEEALIARVLSEQDPGRRRTQDHLRVSGVYRELRARALDKRERLEEAGLQNPTLERAGLTVEELLRWFFRRQGPFLPPDPDHYARTLGFEHVETFLLAVLREFCYFRVTEERAQGRELRSPEVTA